MAAKKFTLSFLSWLMLSCFTGLPLVHSQTTDVKVIAGKQYQTPGFHQWLWGKHYRQDWATPVQVKSLNLDTVNGGLIAYEKGGGRQSKTLRLRNNAGKEYVLRSIDKSFGKALPEIARGTFIEKIVDDQASIAEPYAAITIPDMAAAAGIYHTLPQIVFIPSQKALGEFDKEYGNALYLFEQRPDENWEEAANFGNSKKIVGTDKFLEKILKDSDNRIDQLMYVRARLFDMFIGDWGRHEDQWRWASFEEDGKTIYRPIPRDRDQAYTKFDGVLLGRLLSMVEGRIESFSHDIQDVTTYNYTARNLDRRATNSTTKDQWIRVAEELRVSLPNSLIETSVQKLPPEVSVLSADEIISKLKSRRDKLVHYATAYYDFLAKEVDIPGTEDAELFKVTADSPTSTTVEIYDLDKEGNPKKQPYFSRTFFSTETNELRIYGIGGNDRFEINAKPGTIRTRLIGGPAKDQYSGMGNRQVVIYDNDENDWTQVTGIKKNITRDTSVHRYTYAGFNYDKKGLGPILSYNSFDRLHVGLKYEIEKQQWRKSPFGYRHQFSARYSITERAPSVGYEGVFTQFAGNWNLRLGAEYDWIRWNNYYGIGNDTRMLTDNRDYHRVRSRELLVAAGLERMFGKYHFVAMTPFYQTIKILNDPGRLLTKEIPVSKEFDISQFGGASLDYVYQNLDNTFLPTKGIRVGTNLRFSQNIKQNDSSVLHYSSVVNIYLPVTKALVVALKTGAGSLSGDPQFFQLNKIGGSKTLRGFRKNRFYGESVFFNQAELQFIPDVRTFLFNGKAGLIAFYDIGRVWQPGENSTTWHSGYGGGIVLAPFNKFSVAIMQGWSKNEKAIAIRFSGSF